MNGGEEAVAQSTESTEKSTEAGTHAEAIDQNGHHDAQKENTTAASEELGMPGISRDMLFESKRNAFTCSLGQSEFKEAEKADEDKHTSKEPAEEASAAADAMEELEETEHLEEGDHEEEEEEAPELDNIATEESQATVDAPVDTETIEEPSQVAHNTETAIDATDDIAKEVLSEPPLEKDAIEIASGEPVVEKSVADETAVASAEAEDSKAEKDKPASAQSQAADAEAGKSSESGTDGKEVDVEAEVEPTAATPAQQNASSEDTSIGGEEITVIAEKSAPAVEEAKKIDANDAAPSGEAVVVTSAKKTAATTTAVVDDDGKQSVWVKGISNSTKAADLKVRGGPHLASDLFARHEYILGFSNCSPSSAKSSLRRSSRPRTRQRRPATATSPCPT